MNILLDLAERSFGHAGPQLSGPRTLRQHSRLVRKLDLSLISWLVTERLAPMHEGIRFQTEEILPKKRSSPQADGSRL